MTSISKICEATGMSSQSTRTFLRLLEKDKMINKQTTSKLTRITICNYEYYQGEQQTNNKQINKQTTSVQQGDNKQPTTDNNDKEEIKNDNNEKNKEIEFELFWNLYNRKEGAKKRCEQKWNKLKPEIRQKIIDTLPKWLARIKDKQFQPYPEAYLNQERWNDEITEPIHEDPVERDMRLLKESRERDKKHGN